ncbi:MAG TPA: hypothetical protein VKB69_13905, partial [Micromonosporaceae bacterium]|nr:hypothetical protein [Micromonosporaceae bacterium]
FSDDVHGTLAPDGAPTVATIGVPGQVGIFSFTATAGERVYVDISGSTLPAGCGTFSLHSPENSTLDLGCTSDAGAGQIDGDLLKDDGRYTVVVDPPDGALGQVNLHLITSRDIQGAVTVGGSPVKSSVGIPGQVAFYSFSGTKGQKIKVTVTGTSLAPQCGIPLLVQPDGGTFDLGCLMSGSMTDTLNVTGTWKVKIDPPTTQTGTVTFVVEPG